MPYVVTQSCCSDASCVYACPVNCIHPTPDEPDFLTAEMLHIDPEACVECGACVSACPVDAIGIHSELTPAQQPFIQINADFYKTQRQRPALAQIGRAPATRRDLGPLRVAIVGSGPAAMYAADELLLQPEARVNVFEKLPTPGGLVRAGVAPDHQKTKQVTELFETIADEPGFEYFLNVEVGRDISHAELAATHHAVIYAYGASSDKKLGIEGEELPGCTSATDFVAWYNGHPEHAADRYDLGQERVVIVGNGNVALDVARILTLDPDVLATTDIADHALAALRQSKVREVVILARRGPSESAFTVPEFTGLLETPGVNVVVDIGEQFLADPPYLAQVDPTEAHAIRHKLELLRALPRYGSPEAEGLERRIVLRYLTSPTRILGTDRVSGVEVRNNELVVDGARIGTKPTGRAKRIDAGIVLTSIGYHGEPVAGLPFDEKTGTIPNKAGRVHDLAGNPIPGTYVAGWIKRGPSGFIGTNKSCSQETVNAIVDDFNSGLLPAPTTSWREFEATLRQRQPQLVDRSGWHAIDRAELRRGAAQGRARAKIVDTDELVAVATGTYRQRGLRRAVEAQVNAAFIGAVKTAVKTADRAVGAIDTVLPR